MSGHLCLKWNNHTTAFSRLLHKVYLEDQYSDGTIMCQGKFFPVHRFVLSTCSEYFEELFCECKRLNNKHPFIIVKDIQPEQMEALLNYMYKGEVNVPQDLLPELIKAAEAFKIKGLAVPDEEPCHRSRKRSSVSSPPSVPKKSRRYEDKSSNIGDKTNTYDTKCPENNESSSMPVDKSPTGQANLTVTNNIVKQETSDDQEPIKLEEPDYETFIEDEAYTGTDSLSAGTSSVNVDDVCGSNDNFEECQDSTSWDTIPEVDGDTEDDPAQRLSEDWSSTSSHPLYHQTVSVPPSSTKTCSYPFCNFKASAPSDLKRHIRCHTGEKPFKCLQCPYRSSEHSKIKRHIRAKHSNDKSYQCGYCTHKSNNNYNLKLHVYNRHENRL